MKKLKNIFSLMLVAVFVFAGSLMFTGCFKDTDNDTHEVKLTKEEKILIVKEVLNDAKTKSEISQMFEQGDAIEPKNDAGESVFTQFGEAISGETSDLETISEKYFNFAFSDGGVTEISSMAEVVLQIIELETFEFDEKIGFTVEDDFVVNVKIAYNTDYFILGIYEGEEIFGFYKFNHENNKAVSYEEFEADSYKMLVLSTDVTKRAIDNYVCVHKRTENVDSLGNVTVYYPIIFSESEGKCFTKVWDMINEDSENITQFVAADTYEQMNNVCKNIIDENQSILDSLN